ncbi:pilus (MSHA type) biogenesis protein MshL [Sulfuricystis multivorans]|uniref:pilus (MSHA type) biogenesis protein MshL n=1 Tax=Sulfuricystis multivorans TaxID=2211108 RepID=UPI000F84289A|nr:pilus (MSHA type) biogenesis protein MshL [Sulfuricystis multivorans]
MKKPFSIALLALLLAACSNAPIQPPGDNHLRAEKVVGAGDTAPIPPPVRQTIALPKPKPAAKTETYSVVVNNVRVQELLFALARDAKLNVDIHPGIEGTVTLNAIDQTLQQLLNRIAKQADIRWELDGPNLVVMPDTPFLRTYKVDYVNMQRDTNSTVIVNSQIGAAATGTPTASTISQGNNSQTKIENKTHNRFWETLEANIKDLLRETDKILPAGSSETVIERLDEQSTTGTGAPPPPTRGNTVPNLAASPNPASLQQSGVTVTRRSTFREAASVITNPETGIITVRATSRQHEKVREFLDQVMSAAQRQVLIEATVAEVELSDNYQQGIDWRLLSRSLAAAGAIDGNMVAQAATGLITLQSTRRSGTFQATIKLLEDYGNVKILSSPKLSVLNNQTALLRVVTNNVYFTVKSDVAAGVNGSAPVKAITTTPQTVAVGFVMAVTPQISDGNTITLNVRPSITSIVDAVKDPNPDLSIDSLIPVIRTREMESVLRIESGNIAVMGGLMEDKLDYKNQGLPALSGLPLFGPLFQQRNDTRKKTELVVFLRPVIIKDASLQGDYGDYRHLLPAKDFFEKGNLGPPQPELPTSKGG